MYMLHSIENPRVVYMSILNPIQIGVVVVSDEVCASRRAEEFEATGGEALKPTQ